MAYPYQLTDLRTMVQDSVLEYSSTLFSDDEIDRALNDGQLDIAAKALCIETSVGWLTDVANSRTLDITGLIYLTTDNGLTFLTAGDGVTILTAGAGYIQPIKVLGVEYIPTTGTRTGLLPITPNQLGHVSVKGLEPEFFFRWGKYVGIEPNPAAVTYHLVVHIAQAPSAFLTNATPLPTVPDAYVLLLVDYAVFRCLLKLRKWGSAIGVYNEYTGKLKTLRKTVTVKYAGKAEDTLIPDKVQTQ
jgi:hypothetical protein